MGTAGFFVLSCMARLPCIYLLEWLPAYENEDVCEFKVRMD